MPSDEDSPFHAEPFQVRVDQAVIEDLRARVRAERELNRCFAELRAPAEEPGLVAGDITAFFAALDR